MSMITLAISCLTTSNLPWFMDIIFQVPMQYCIHFTCRKSNAQNSPRQTSTIYEPRLPDVRVGFRKGRRTRDQTANISWIIGKARGFQKNIYFCFIDFSKPFDSVDHKKQWEILKEMGIPDHLDCLLRNLYAGQEATVRTGHRKTDWFQIAEGLCQACILSPCLFNLYAEYIMRNTGLDEA